MFFFLQQDSEVVILSMTLAIFHHQHLHLDDPVNHDVSGSRKMERSMASSSQYPSHDHHDNVKKMGQQII